MKTNVRKSQIVSGMLVLLLLFSLFGSFYQYKSKQGLKEEMNREKLNSESLLSEKLQLEKEIRNFQNQISALSGKNESLDGLLNASKDKLDKKEKEIENLLKENAKVKSLKKQLDEVRQMRTEMEAQIQDLLATIAKLEDENARLNNTMASLQHENNMLKAENLQNKLADDYRVDAVQKKKMKLTAIAKRANALIASFTLAPEAATDLKFKIVNPSGEKIEGEEKGVSFTTIDESSLLASLNPQDGMEITKRIEMTYRPAKKMMPGIYKIELYSGDYYIGSCQVKLR